MPNLPSTLRRDDCALVVIDMQAKLMPAIDGGEKAVAKTVFLAEVAEKFGVPMLFTEQNPSGLGPTVALSSRLSRSFSSSATSALPASPDSSSACRRA